MEAKPAATATLDRILVQYVLQQEPTFGRDRVAAGTVIGCITPFAKRRTCADLQSVSEPHVGPWPTSSQTVGSAVVLTIRLELWYQ
jgi:hypothetical protein